MSSEEIQPAVKRKWRLFAQPLAREIEQIVKPVYQQHGFNEHRILTEWANVVGQDLAAGSAPQKLTFAKGKRENGTLHVVVSSGARALELQHMQPMILERISTYFGFHAIEKIIFHQDSSLHIAAKKPRKKTTSAPAEDETLATLVNPCEDDLLRKALHSLGDALKVTQRS